jgi:MtN3 and saliva related transmembrane protein
MSEKKTAHVASTVENNKESNLPWYKTKRFLSGYEKYMMTMGIVGQLLFYLQALKIYQTRSAEDISMAGFLIAFFSLSSWLVYGLILNNRVLVFVNVAGCFGALLVILLKFMTDLSWL